MARYLITAAAGGIGSALASALAERGHEVILTARRAEPLAALAAELGCESHVLDASDQAAVGQLVAACQDAGPLAGIANLAGSLLLKPAHLTQPADFAAIIQANLQTAFAVVAAAGAHCRDANVVLMSSAAARHGLANHEAIAAAKAGVEGLTRSAAATYAKRGLRINAVAPGLVETPLAQPITSVPAIAAASAGMHPLGRIGQPNDVVAMLLLLLDPATTWITGQVIGVDGGLGVARGGK